MSLIFYRAFIHPLLLIFTFSFGIFSKKIRAGLKLRMDRKFKLANCSKNTKPIWIHCSSGEFEYAKPVLRALKKHNYKTLITFYSPSHVKQILACPDVDFAHPLPFDIPGPLQSYFKHFQPQALLFARTDVWPELTVQAKKYKVPTLLFSRTQKEVSDLKKKYLHWNYKNLSSIDCVSPDDANNLSFLNNTEVTTNGDSRFDEVIHRKNLKKNIKQIESSNFTFVMGSVWPEDLNAIIDNQFLAYAKKNKVQIIVCPHEVSKNNIDKVKSTLNDDCQLYSQISEAQPDKPLIIDEYGLLFEVYKSANLSFVGGSFKKNVHSVMEPLAWGSPVVVGPHNKNNREAQEFLKVNIDTSLAAVSEVTSSEDLIAVIEKIRTTKVDSQKIILDAIKERTGASDSILHWVQKNTTS